MRYLIYFYGLLCTGFTLGLVLSTIIKLYTCPNLIGYKWGFLFIYFILVFGINWCLLIKQKLNFYKNDKY